MQLKNLVLVFALSLIGYASPASAFSDNNLPSCDAPSVLNYIQDRFVWTDRHMIRRDLAIERIERAQLNRNISYEKGHLIPKKYCRGTAYMNDGRKRQIWWLMEAGMGLTGVGGKNLEFCISGLDSFKVHGAWCRSVR